MSSQYDVTYTLDFAVRRRSGPKNQVVRESSADNPNPRIARLMALAIRLDGLIREQTLPNYAAVARRGRVTRARMTQIMKLLHLAPDLQEHILFLPPSRASRNATCGRLCGRSTGTSSGASCANSPVRLGLSRAR